MTEYRVELTDEQAQEFQSAWSLRKPNRSSGAEFDAAYALADAIRAQMPKPRMAEPGLKPQVIASVSYNPARRGWVRVDDLWVPVDDVDGPEAWEDLIDPEPVDGAR